MSRLRLDSTSRQDPVVATRRRYLELVPKHHPLSKHVVSGTIPIPIPIPILGGWNHPLGGNPPLTMPECIGIGNWERSRIPNSNPNSKGLEFGIVPLVVAHSHHARVHWNWELGT